MNEFLQAHIPLPSPEGPNTSAESEDEAQAHTPLPSPEGPTTSAPRIFAIDPAESKPSAVFNGKRCWEVTDLEAFVKRNPDSIIATESTIHGYHVKTRESLLQASKKYNVLWMAARSIFTSRARGGPKEDDKTDARAIWKNFVERRGLFYLLRPPSETLFLGTINKPGTSRFEANIRLVQLRREGYPGFKNHREAAISVLTEVAREFGLNRKERDSLAGFHACGYGSLWRSNRNKHGKKFSEATRDAKKADMRAFRQQLRQFWAQALLPLPSPEGPSTSAPETFLDEFLQELNK